MKALTLTGHTRKSSVMPLTSGVLQRNCACGQHTVAGGECESCQKEKSFDKLSRATRNHESETRKPNGPPSIVGEVMESLSQADDRRTSQFLDSQFAHDFSSVDVSASPLQRISPEGRAWSRFRVQPKLTINEAGDAYEQEADRVADGMMGSFVRPTTRRSDKRNASRSPTESDLTQGGERLIPDVARFFEGRFGHDFSAVRVHMGETSARYNDVVNAYAFTYGNHIWLGPGLRQQRSHILAHELAHVVQQTQPPRIPSNTGVTNLSQSHQTVQRFVPYWMPEDFTRVGEESHALILPVIGKQYKIFTEAPVPHAGKDGAAPGFEKQGGIADLYQASNTVDVFFSGKRLPKKLSSNPRLFSRLLRAGKPYAYEKSAPQAAEGNNVIRVAHAPTEIRIGDLKPSHGTIEAAEGPEQVKGYLKGFEIAHEEVNEMDVGTGGYQQTDAKWKPLTTGLINFEVPEQFKEPVPRQKARPLKLMKGGTRVDLPNLSRPVMGKVYVRPSPDGGGIWNYTWAPTTRLTSSDLPESVTEFGEEVTAKIIRPLLASPVAQAKKARPEIRSGLAASPRRIQIKGRESETTEVNDPFDKPAFEAWKADHARLTGQEKELEKTPAFKQAEFMSILAEEREAAIKSRFNFPAVPKEQAKATKTVGKIQFWTGASSAIFGRLRYWFGGAFVKVYNAYHAIRARFQKSLESREDSPKSGGLLGTVVKIAFKVLKIAGRILVERTAQELVSSLKKGVAAKLKSLIPVDLIEEFEAKVKEVQAVADYLEHQVFAALEGLVDATIGPYEKHIATIIEWAEKLSDVAEVVNKVRWGARVIACLSPPGWGCLWILAQSVLEKFASWLIDRCWFKKAIAPLVTAVDFIAKLPAKLAEFIIDQIRRILPDQLHDVFADIDPSQVSQKFADYEICSENDYPTTRDRDLLEKLALEELRHDIGEAKWEAWTKLAKLYGTNLGEPLSVEKIEQLKKELVRADLNAMKEAAELYPAFVPTEGKNAVIDLTTFLEEAEQKKQEMYGGGAGGGEGGPGGGKAGIELSASEKPLEGPYKLSFKFEVVSGVKRGQYEGDVIHVNVANTIKGTVVTLNDVEVVVGKRRLLSGDKMEVPLIAKREQFFDVESKLGAETVRKIGVKRFVVRKGRTYRYVLPLR